MVSSFSYPFVDRCLLGERKKKGTRKRKEECRKKNEAEINQQNSLSAPGQTSEPTYHTGRINGLINNTITRITLSLARTHKKKPEI